MDLDTVKAYLGDTSWDDDEIEAVHADPFTGENEMDDGGLLTVAAPRLAADDVDPNDPTTWGKVQRNAPCPCGSGKKFKHCHGSHG